MEVVAVAYSGGRDSTALLHATITAAATAGWRVVALHVHHGLSAGADRWLAHCADQCRRWSLEGGPVEFAAHRLIDRPPPGASVEAWARTARYDALARLARVHDAGVVLLGHHRRDQAETLLLQALRGGGVGGLAGMPDRVERDGLVWLRPWLDRPRAEIDAYLAHHALTHVDDDSNVDPRFARNRLRLVVWPVLEAAFPNADATLAASSRWAQEADAALAELASIDLAAVAVDGAIDVASWTALSPARRSLALRAWVRDVTGVAAPSSLVTRLLDELPERPGASWPAPNGVLRVHRGRLRFASVDDGSAFDSPPEPALHVDRAGTYRLPGWGGSLRVEAVETGGISLARLGRLDLKRREGGERFQSGPRRPPRSLKKQFQAAGVPSWERNGPLVYSGGLLVYVPGLGLDARVVVPPGQVAVALHWLAARGPG